MQRHGGEMKHGLLACHLDADLFTFFLQNGQLVSLRPIEVVKIEVTRTVFRFLELVSQTSTLSRNFVEL